MVKLNIHYSKLSGNYLFPEIAKRVAATPSKRPLLNLGVGDVTRPLPPSVVSALSEAVLEMGDPQTFRGYGPSDGYPFLKNAISEHDYQGLIAPSEIFISEGAKSDIANIQELFCINNRVALPDPTYPVYLDTTVMAGRSRPLLKTGRYGGITYLPCNEENGFCPHPPSDHCDLIYLCSPNNPTGSAMGRELLKSWVDYAKAHQAIIIFDGAYEAYITSEGTPRSIYEIEGAREVAIEIRSYSKTAGFTGLRLSYTVVPHELRLFDCGKEHSIHALWKRRQDTKYGGAPYLIQKGAAAIYTPQGKKEIAETIDAYSQGARYLLEGLQSLGLSAYGGIDAPYIWCKTPDRLTSWQFFDRLLEKGVIAIPGCGFGLQGERFVRFSAFAPKEILTEALTHIQDAL